MPEITVVAGARPNFMKVAPLLRALKGTPFQVRLVHTGQHYDAAMSEVFFQQLEIPAPDVHLGVGSGRHGQQTARVLELFEEYLIGLQQPPAGVAVVGDVNSTMACTLAAVKLGIPVAHIEAGLRSFDRTMPEEINRVVTDSIASLLLVSEPAGEENLKKEGIAAEKIVYAGNTMIDTLVRQSASADNIDVKQRFGVDRESFALVTLHRPSNVDHEERLKELVEFLLFMAEHLKVIFPVHPRTRARLTATGLAERLRDRVILDEPIGYIENLALMRAAKVVITDSGGMQEETTFLNVPCLTLRAGTERPVTITHGTNTIVGSDLELAKRCFHAILDGVYRRSRPIPGWDGHAAERIAVSLCEAWL